MDVSESIEVIWDRFLEAMSHESEKDRNHWFIEERFCHFFSISTTKILVFRKQYAGCMNSFV